MTHNARMGLIDRIFGNGKERDAAPGASTQFNDSQPDSEDPEGSRDTSHRELVQVILRDTMRKHGIPSDWIECRILSTVSRSGRRGLHMNLVVRKAHERLLTYVFAFQDSFERELARYDPRARDWLLSLGWEFQGFNAAEMPDPRTWVHSGPAPLQGLPPLVPGDAFQSKMRRAAEEDVIAPPKSDEDIQRDLQALFAIRDAAMADTVVKPPAGETGDFQPTQPFEDSGDKRT